MCNGQEHWSNVNMAIVDCLTIGPLDNWDYVFKLKLQYSKEVVDDIISILNFLKNIQPNWDNETYNEFLQKAKQIITNSYGKLSADAVNVLVNRLAYDWK